MRTELLLFLLGLVMLILGGDSFVGYSVGLAGRLRLPAAAVGATVVAIGTSLPEILVSVTAAMGGNGRIAAGSAMGSIIYNAALAGGLLLLLRPASGLGRRDLLKRLFFFLLAACFAAFSIMKTGVMSVGLGVILLSLFAVYALTGASGARTQKTETERFELIVVGLIVGAAALYMGSCFVVENGILLAHSLGMPERLVAITFVALGTALPDIAAALSAVIRRQPALALGNIVGANIINLLLVIGIPAIIAPMKAETDLLRDMTAASAAMLLLILPPVCTGKTYRWQGILLILGFGAYMAVNFI